MPSLVGMICLVTGATRGIGKGIALQLGEAGATVYVTGRTLKPKGDVIGGSLQETAKEIESRGGTCIPVQCDHTKDSDIEALFERINREQDGRLDLLVNNAYSAVTILTQSYGKKFWELPPNIWDDVNTVGLRNHYLCTCHAAKMMVARNKGLIVMVSSVGGLRYGLNVAYGVGKEALDRMAADCAEELRKQKVACVSLWPGGVRTEHMEYTRTQTSLDWFKKVPREIFENGETPEYPGKCIVHMMADEDIMSKSGKILISADLGDEYGFVDVDGRRPMNLRSVSLALLHIGWRRLAQWIPYWIKTPKILLSLAGNKF